MKGKICILLSIILLALAVIVPWNTGETDSAASKVERVASRRLAILEEYAEKMLAASPYEWTDLSDLPRDMAIYRYVNDSLQCWANNFTVINDDITGRNILKRLTNPRISRESPLAAVGDSLGFYNFGPKWFLAKSREEGQVKVIYGLAVQNSLDDRSFYGLNRQFHLRDNYTFQPVSSGEGSVVCIDGRPLMRIRYESLSGGMAVNGIFVWIAFGFFVIGSFFLLAGRRTLKQYSLVASGLTLAVAAMFIWGRSAQDQFGLFSPLVFADGPVFYSLGAIVFINLIIFFLSTCLYMVRKDIFDRMSGRWKTVLGCSGVVLALIAILLYTHLSLNSIIINSDISLELYKFGTLSRYTFIVYASYLTMLISVPLLLALLTPMLRLAFGVKFDPFSRKSRIVFSVAIALYMVLVSSILGFRKEQERLEVRAGRIAFDRDVSLEMRLRGAEVQISSDPVLASLTILENGGSSLMNRLMDVHFGQISQKYEISLLTDEEYLDRFGQGEQISPDSNFLYAGTDNGFPCYACLFYYNIPGYGITHFALSVEPRPDNKLGAEEDVPSVYSYARYKDGRVITFNGSFAYPLKMDLVPGFFAEGGYTHFVTEVADGEYVVMSRPNISPLNYFIFMVLLSLIAFLVVSLFCIRKPKESDSGRKYYRRRINTIVMVSLILTLLTMMTVSVVFVYRRNESNVRNMMSDKINGIQNMLAGKIRALGSTEELFSPEIMSVLETIALGNDTDITLYSPDGKVQMTTGTARADNILTGMRMNGDAYKSILFDGDRYCILRERVGARRYYSMYAPLMNADGEILAFVGAPYSDENYDFKRDAVSHLMMILTVFLLLLILARFASMTIVDRLFKPLSKMGRRMRNAGQDSLQKIEYDRDDEVSTLVQSYNRMVDELEASSKVLAQAERDKAWSEMARQVAHEIKNPLTPMKLQLQRIIRLKQKGDPSWQDKFDEMTTVLLDHIDILTDTANEFSTFAKLYTEEPTEMNLDLLLQEEIAMFDNKGGVRFEYFGLEGSMATGPKPQLTRVFVNLINNSVQALGDRQDGVVRIALRNSSADGFYDIVFEDNGPGVSEENEGRLFTPNFTTKNGGSGLGLAISRSILERCGASIAYSKSFALGGACFTIRYPK